MLALVVPSATEADLFYQFLRLRDSWPQQAIEIKGSKLKEDQAAQVIDLLAAHDVIAEFYGIDMARHPTDIIGHGSMSPSIILFRGVQVSSGGLYGRSIVRTAPLPKWNGSGPR